MLHKLTVTTILVTLLLIIVGGATRVYDAGMACPDWPHCYGVWWPWPEARVIAAGHPEGYVVNGQHYQAYQVALEWGHRLLAAVVGVMLLGLIALAIKAPKAVWIPLATTIILLMLQIKLGAVTVWFSNIHWSVVIHLGNAMLFLGALVWLRRVVAHGSAARQLSPRPVVLATSGFALLAWITMLAGAFVSSSHSGGVCGGLPSCGGAWLPADWQQQAHMLHRLLGITVMAASIGLIILTKRLAPTLKPLAVKVHGIMWGQVALGVLTLYSFASYPDFYYPLSIAHLAWGTVLFISALGLVLSAIYGPHARFHGRFHGHRHGN